MGRRLTATDPAPRLTHPAAPATVDRRAAGAAWPVALELADGDPRRLEVLGAGEVLVRNRPR